MTEHTTYYKPTKLDYVYDAATFINDEVKLKKIINKIKHYFNRNKKMATSNYTEAMTEKMIAKYNANPTRGIYIEILF